MSKMYDELTPDLQDFITAQNIFFVATAAQKGRINLSPKGHNTLCIIDSKTLIWLNLTGSGNETAAHLLKNDRMTIMLCAFQGKPLILRIYGHAKIYHERDTIYQNYIGMFEENTGSRQIIVLNIDSLQTSCGFAIPLMDFKAERSMLNSWSKKQGKKRIKSYWQEKNVNSIDGFETKILED